MPCVLKYQVCFKKLTKKFLEEDPDFYAKAVIILRLEELHEKCAYMVKCNKANSSGTKITFAPVRSVEEYTDKLNEIIADGEKIGLIFTKENGKQEVELCQKTEKNGQIK